MNSESPESDEQSNIDPFTETEDPEIVDTDRTETEKKSNF